MRPALLLVPLLALAGCGTFTSDAFSCGTAREGGGPPLFVTRGQELCATARRATHVHYAGLAEAPPRRDVERTYAEVERLPRAASVDDLIARLRAAVGERVADDVAAAVAWARTRSDKRRPADPERAERALIEGAAKGVRIALEERFPYLGDDDLDG